LLADNFALFQAIQPLRERARANAQVLLELAKTLRAFEQTRNNQAAPLVTNDLEG
jgi:hypothetical protein